MRKNILIWLIFCAGMSSGWGVLLFITWLTQKGITAATNPMLCISIVVIAVLAVANSLSSLEWKNKNPADQGGA